MGALAGLAAKALEAGSLAASLGLSAGVIAATLPVRAGAYAVQVGGRDPKLACTPPHPSGAAR